MPVDAAIFKDYDIRGTYPDQVNAEVATAIAYAIIRHFKPKTIAIGRDMRTSGGEIHDALVDVFTKMGLPVYDAGLIGTEIQYYIAGTFDFDLVLMISASHNPREYNGIKVVKRGPIAVTLESGLRDVQQLIASGPLPIAPAAGEHHTIDVTDGWREKVLSLVDTSTLLPLSVVADAGNGMAGKLVPNIFRDLPINLTPLYFELDGSFPHHVPNPLIESNNRDLVATVQSMHADIGITFDGDADRIFLIDDRGRMVSGSITTALLARYYLSKHPGELILYNAICGRIVPETIAKYGGKSKRVRVGHSYIKTYMRETNAIFAGEHSGHYYYRDFFHAESGVLTALIVLSLLSHEKKKLSDMVDELSVYPASGEINFVVSDIPRVVTAVRTQYSDATEIDDVDGMSVWYNNYWFNIRASKTEPLLRLNVEADTKEILDSKTKELVQKIESLGGKKK